MLASVYYRTFLPVPVQYAALTSVLAIMAFQTNEMLGVGWVLLGIMRIGARKIKVGGL